LPQDHCTNLLVGWEGYAVQSVQRVDATNKRKRASVQIELVRTKPTFTCSACGQDTPTLHEVTWRCVRDLPILDADTYVWFLRYRVACPTCGPKVEALPWLSPWARVTRRLADSIIRLCQVLPIQHVAAVEPRRKRVLWVGKGRAREDVRPFFTQLGPEGCRRLRAVVMDMNPAYEEEVRTQCPHAEIVYDLFHVVAKYGRVVIDRVRVDEANRLRHDRAARQVIKGARWLLLRNRENVRPEDRVKLRELLAANRRLAAVYVLKDDLKHLWRYSYPGAARRFFDEWYQRAARSRIGPLKTFARNLKVRLAGILAHCRFPFHTSLLEGINNKIKVLKRMAFGYRDDAYFFLKIMDAFPGFAG